MALSNFLRNKIIDWFHRAQTYTPPANVYIALCTTAPVAGTGGTEVSTSGTGYARQAIASSLTDWAGTQGATTTAASSGTTGTTSNNLTLSFGSATISWGTISHWEAYDAPTGGNRLFYGTIVDAGGAPTPRAVGAGDPVAFPLSAIVNIWS